MRNDLIVALYDSREYLQLHIKQRGEGWLTKDDDPFSSSTIPNPPNANCVFAAKSGKFPRHLTYKYLGDAVQGLMDYTFYPYSASVDSLNFEVSHNVWGVLGSGSLTSTPATTVAR